MLENDIKHYHDNLTAAENYLLVTLPELPENVIARDAENIISIIHKHSEAVDFLKILKKDKKLKELFANIILQNISESSKNLILSSVELSLFCIEVLAEARADTLINHIYENHDKPNFLDDLKKNRTLIQILAKIFRENINIKSKEIVLNSDILLFFYAEILSEYHPDSLIKFIYDNREAPGFLAKCKQNKKLMDLLDKTTLGKISNDATQLILKSVSLNIFFADILTEKHTVLYKAIVKKRIPSLIAETRSIYNSEIKVIEFCKLYYSFFTNDKASKNFIELLGEAHYQQLLESLKFIMECEIPGNLQNANQIKPDSLAKFLEFWQTKEFITRTNHVLRITRIYEKIKRNDELNELQAIIDFITGYTEEIVDGKARRRQSENMVSNFFALLSRPLQSIHMCLKSIEGGFDKVIDLNKAINLFEDINSAFENNLDNSAFELPTTSKDFNTSYMYLLPGNKHDSRFSTPIKAAKLLTVECPASPILPSTNSPTHFRINASQLNNDNDFLMPSNAFPELSDDEHFNNSLYNSKNTLEIIEENLNCQNFYVSPNASYSDLNKVVNEFNEKKDKEQVQFILTCTDKLEENRKQIEFIKSETLYIYKKLTKDNWHINFAFQKLGEIDINTSLNKVASAFNQCKPKTSKSCFSFFDFFTGKTLNDTLYANFGSAENIERAYLARSTLNKIVDTWIKVKDKEWLITGLGGEHCHLTKKRRSYLLPKHAAEIIELYDKAESYDGISWEQALAKTVEILIPLYREKIIPSTSEKPQSSQNIVYKNKPKLRSEFTQGKYNEALKLTQATLKVIKEKYPANKDKQDDCSKHTAKDNANVFKASYSAILR